MPRHPSRTRRLPRAKTAIAALCALLTAAPSAIANDGWVAAPNSRVRLNWCGTNFTGPLDPKAALLAYVEIQLEPGWKTYWRMPGDSGVPPTFEWADTSNLAKTTVYYPAPQRLPDQGGEAIGYKTSAIFPIRIERRDIKSPTPLTLTLNYGVCKNICVPIEVTLNGACLEGGGSAAIAAAVEAVPRAPDQRRDSDPKLASVKGSVAGAAPRLTVDVDFGAGAAGTDLFIEAPDGLFVPLPARAKPDAKGRASFTVDLSKALDAKELLGKELRLTMVSSKGASEATWVAK